MCATYLINCLPSTFLENISPYEKLFGHAPDNSQLKAYGCLCYVSTCTIKQGRTKFTPGAEPCIFVRYLYAQKGYKVFNIKSKQLLVSRDVYFHEKYFPYHNIQIFLHLFQHFTSLPHLPILVYLLIHDLPSHFQVYITKASQWHESHTYHVAAQDPAWQQAMQQELHTVEHNHTWDSFSSPW